jgi:hypothetical protein
MKKTVLICAFIIISSAIYAGTFAQVADNNRDYSLYQNTPNPFEETTSIKFSLKQDGYVKIFVSDTDNGDTYMLVDGEMTTGEHGVIFKHQQKGAGSRYKCYMEVYHAVNSAPVFTAEIEMKQKQSTPETDK